MAGVLLGTVGNFGNQGRERQGRKPPPPPLPKREIFLKGGRRTNFETWGRIDFIHFTIFKGQGGAVKRQS